MNEIDFKRLGQNIECARVRVRMSQETAAALLELPLEAYQRIEAGEIMDIKLDLFMSIVHTLHFSVDALLIGTFEGSEDLISFK